jgi:hypothetical protein
MSLEQTIFYAFVTGEVSPAFWGRSDLTKYDLGVALAENFLVDYRGGLISRQGSELGGLMENASGVKLSRFRGTDADTLLVFTAGKLRFMQENSYITLPAQTITTLTTASDATFTLNDHGYSDGDLVEISAASGMVELHGRQFLIGSAATNTFKLTTLAGGVVNLSAYTTFTGVETVAEVYTIATPYTHHQLYNLNVVQRYNDIRLTHIDHPRKQLTFTSSTSWALTDLTSGSSIAPPTTLTGSASTTGVAGTSFAVTSIGSDGVESVISKDHLTGDIVNYTATAGSYTLSWAVVTGAVSYNVYRSLVLAASGDVTRGASLAYIGSTAGNEFTDNNITPDYTKLAPVNSDPFAENSPYIVNVTAGGTNYDKGTTMSLSGGGSGFIGYPIVNSSAKIGGVKIISAGHNYGTSPAVTLADVGSGSGATFTVATRGEADKTHPSLFLVFQQRGVYLASHEQPATFWASKPGSFNNYDHSAIVNAGDGYSFTIDSIAVEPIKHALAIRNMLLLFTDDGVTQIRAETGKAVSGVNALAEPQVYSGVSSTPPIAVDLDVIYLTENGASLNSLLFTEYTESFELEDLSVLASHLLVPDAQITRMVQHADPYKLVYMPRADGTMLTLTRDRKQAVTGWARHRTLGNYLDMAEIREATGTYVYQVVQRFLQDSWQTCIERLPTRDDSLAENYWGVDCGVSLPTTYPDAALYASGTSGDVTLTASAAVFSAGSVDDIVYYAGGKLVITAYLTTTTVSATYLREATQYLHFGPAPVPQIFATGSWSMDTPTTLVTGLWHLEGQTVSISYDGHAELNYVVSGGTITLPIPSTKAYVGLPYDCSGTSLPLIVPNKLAEGQKSKVFSAVPRLSQTRGLTFGPSFDALEEMRDRTDEQWGDPLGLRSDVSVAQLDAAYDYNAQVYWRQSYPLPASLLGFVIRADLGEA